MRRLLFLVYDGFELLDLAGSSSVMGIANRVYGIDLYEVMVVSVNGGGITSNSGSSMSPELS